MGVVAVVVCWQRMQKQYKVDVQYDKKSLTTTKHFIHKKVNFTLNLHL